MLGTFLKCLLIHHYPFMFKMRHEMAIRSLMSCADLVDWGIIGVIRWLVDLSLGGSLNLQTI